MGKEIEKKTCPECESVYKVVYNTDDTAGVPKFCPFCGCEAYDEDHDSDHGDEDD